ncbi:MAG: hypothetical protein R2849_00065 [Thermomicrobiales bacterium]
MLHRHTGGGHAAALALTGALALACSFGPPVSAIFLAQPRSDAARDAREVSRSMHGGMALLAAGCIGLGILPIVLFEALQPVTRGCLSRPETSPSLGLSGHMLNPSGTAGSMPVLVVAGLVALGRHPLDRVARLLTGAGRSRLSPTWVCGVGLEPRMQYSATAFAKPIRLIFKH